jgi:hypothetical protein
MAEGTRVILDSPHLKHPSARCYRVRSGDPEGVATTARPSSSRARRPIAFPRLLSLDEEQAFL